MRNKAYFQSELKTAIQLMIDDGCESDEWQQNDAWIHDELSEQMADAAMAVWESAVSAQKFCEREGVFNS